MSLKRVAGQIIGTGIALGILAGGLVACNHSKTSLTESSFTESSQAVVGDVLSRDKLLEGLNTLKAREDAYLIASEMSMPDGDVFYIEVIDNALGNAYTEYPVDKDGNVGTLSFYSGENTQYQLFDWWTLSGKSYTFQSTDEQGGIWLEMPTKYGEVLKSRNTMYLDILLEDAYDFNDGSDITEEGGAEVKLYTCKVPSSRVSEVMGIDSLELYYSIYEDAIANNDKPTVSLAQKYIDELNMNLVFSEGLLTIQTTDGNITGMTLEAGGCGTRMYLTKTIALFGDDVKLRDVPDFTGASKYYDSVKELADYVEQYGSYEEAMIELSKINSELQSQVTDLEKTKGTLESTTN